LDLVTHQILLKPTNEGASWTSINYYAPYVIDVSPQDSNTVFMSHTNELSKSIDGGTNWTKVLTGEANTNITKMVFAPTNPDIIYVATDHYFIFKSTDGGDAFTEAANLRDFIDNY